jgi:hypothetical protein
MKDRANKGKAKAKGKKGAIQDLKVHKGEGAQGGGRMTGNLNRFDPYKNFRF